MKKKKLKSSLKVALASTIAVTSAAAIVYATPEIIKTVAAESSENKFVLDVEKIDGDTIKVSLDNIEDIPRAIQFSINLNGVVIKEENGSPIIKDLINKDKSNSIITDYTYNKEANTVDVLVTSIDDLPKIGNKVEIFELDIEKASDNNDKTYSVTATDGSVYKYVSTTNKEYVSKDIELANKALSINTAPTIKKKNGVSYIEINVGEKLLLTKEELSKYIEVFDADGDNLSLEVKDRDNNVITEFSNNTAGIYDLYIKATDNYESTEALNLQIKVNAKQENPIITRNEEELKDIIIKSGQFDTLESLIEYLQAGVKAIDIDNNKLDVNIEVDENIILNPEKTENYIITYKAKDSKDRETIKEIALTIRVNTAPVIIGVKDHVLTVGDEFDPRKDVTVEDDYDKNLEVKIQGTVDTSKAGEYTLIYTVNDSDGALTEVISKVTVKSKDDNNQGGNGDTSTPGEDIEQAGDSDTSKPGEDTTIIVPDFIENIIDDKVISKVSGEATIENPLVLDIQNVSLDEFNIFIDKLKDLNPILIEKYNNGNYTIYKMKLENSQNLIQRIFSFRRVNEEGIVEIRVLNTLDYVIEFNNILDELLKINLDDDINQGGNGEETPEESTEDVSGIVTPGESTEGGNETGTSGNSIQNGNIDNNAQQNDNKDENKNNNNKLPITGQESMLGILGFLAVAIGGVIYKKKK